MIQTRSNRYYNGKVNKDAPVQAVCDDQQIAVGKNATEAKANAMLALFDAFKRNQEYPEVRIAADGSVFVGRQTTEDRVEYSRYRRDEEGNTRSCGSSSGGLRIYESGFNDTPVSLKRYMDHTVAEYNAVTEEETRYDAIQAQLAADHIS